MRKNVPGSAADQPSCSSPAERLPPCRAAEGPRRGFVPQALAA